MKRKTLLFLLGQLFLVPLSLCAYDFKSGDLCYNITSNTEPYTVEVTYEKRSSNYAGLTTIVIPETVVYNGTTYTVTRIGISAFNYCSALTSVTIGKGVTSIGDYAFSGCSGLTSITIPKSVTSIWYSAFDHCYGLTSIIVENGNSVFDSRNNCNAIIETATNTLSFGCQNTMIPNNVTSIGEFAFQYCSGLTSITIPESVTSIGYAAFSSCSGLMSVNIPNSVTSIGNYAFSYCTGLTSITIPESVTSIGDDAFSGCSGLTSITIPESVTNIGDDAFDKCTGLTSIIWNAKDCRNFSVCPFQDSQITSFTFGDKVEYIPSELCSGMNKLTSITIPESVTNIGSCAFSSCYSLTSITIPENVTYIGRSAFFECNGLTSVTIPNSVTDIGSDAFWGCRGLTSVTIGNSVTSIGSDAFYGCSHLASIVVENGNSAYDSRDKCNAIIETATNKLIIGCSNTIIPNSVTSIGSEAFCGRSGLTSIIIPESVTNIGNEAFENCNNLATIIFHDSITSVGRDAFNETLWYENQPDGIIYIGKTLYKYKGDMPANTSIVVKDGTLQICYRALGWKAGLVSVTIPESVTTIGVSAFKGCSNLTSIHWNAKHCEGLPVGEDYAPFYGCLQITSFTFGDKVEYIPSDLCSGMDKLTSITLPESVTNIGSSAFFGCSGLVSVIIPDSVTSIEKYAFDGCTGLTSVTFPESVTSIGTDAFFGCDSLTSIVSLNTESPLLYNSLGGASNKVVIVPHSAVAAYQSAKYWKDCNISSDGFDINVSTTFTKAKITASYLGNTNNVVQRFGYILGNDTIWQTNTADSIVWQLEGLQPDSTYQFCLYKENGIPQKHAFRTKSTFFDVDIPKTTQTTATVRFIYDFGDTDIDSDVDYIQGYLGDARKNVWRLHIKAPQGTIDTTFAHLLPDTEYSIHSTDIVLKNGKRISTLIDRPFRTLPVALGAPRVLEYGQTYAAINYNYDYGDATVLHNVLDFKLSGEDDAIITTMNVTDAQSKVTNLIPDTTYYFRHVLEVDGCDSLIQPLQPVQTISYDFESTEDNAHWHFINGTQSNKWIINTSAGSNGTGNNALYVSKGTSYSYNADRASSVWAYCDDILSGTVTISFDWKRGEYGDNVYAYLIPVSASQPTAGSWSGEVSEDAIQIGGTFYGQSSWTMFTDKTRTLTGQYRLYFWWRNHSSGDNTPIAIDNVVIKIQSGKPDWQEFTTKPIMLTTQFADGLSNTSALLHGTVDCDQESYTEVGFEWKRSDAPATVNPQRLLVTDRVDENLLFRLEGLSSDHYYDFRTFCSYQGKTYYGEWVGFLTSDKEVLVAPTVQTVGATANEQGAEMEGFIVAGTEPVLQKGFEVWIKGSTDVKTTVAEGHIIRALIPEPWSYTTYQYKAYAKTASGTTYGETMEITTGYIPRDVQDIVVTPSSNSAEVTWTKIEVADYYILTLFADEAMTDTIAVYQVGTNGSINRLRIPSAVKALVTCSISDLVPATDYYFAVVAYNSANQKVAEENGTFATTSDTDAIFQPSAEQLSSVRKVLYNGQVFILRGNEVYTVLGEKVK